MADEPSMDEILASLDRLLKEGEGRNDEPAEQLPQSPSEDQTGKPTQEPDSGFLKALDEVAAEASTMTETSKPKVPEKPREDKGKPNQEAGAQKVPAAPDASKRIVLTDAMMVDDVQQTLPLGDSVPARSGVAGSAGPTAVPAAAEPVSAGAAEVTSLDERDIQALVDQVTDDVCSAMAEQLPDMIRRALVQRLTSFVTDRVKNQDSRSED